MNRKGKKWIKKKGVKIESSEAYKYDNLFASLMTDFNKFLFEDGAGSFVGFDLKYRALATRPWRFIKPDPNYFTEFAISR